MFAFLLLTSPFPLSSRGKNPTFFSGWALGSKSLMISRTSSGGIISCHVEAGMRYASVSESECHVVVNGTDACKNLGTWALQMNFKWLSMNLTKPSENDWFSFYISAAFTLFLKKGLIFIWVISILFIYYPCNLFSSLVGPKAANWGFVGQRENHRVLMSKLKN